MQKCTKVYLQTVTINATFIILYFMYHKVKENKLSKTVLYTHIKKMYIPLSKAYGSYNFYESKLLQFYINYCI
jgi:hypothetical protein